MSGLIEDWCDSSHTSLTGRHKLHVLSEKNGGRAASRDAVARAMAAHYEDPQVLSDRIRRRGYKKAAQVLQERFPKTKKARSAHMGEILAAEVVPSLFPTFHVPINRLRWNDGRETALRGEDIIAVEQSGTSVRFLKGESKSGISIATDVVADARTALNANDGRPSFHAMGFIMNRLLELGQEALAIVFEEYMLADSIRSRQLIHMSFGLTGNDSARFYTDDINKYAGKIEQHAVCWRIPDHQAFIEAAYQDLNQYAPKS